jgi:hypothetical protein
VWYFADYCFSSCRFSLSHCVACPSIYVFDVTGVAMADVTGIAMADVTGVAMADVTGVVMADVTGVVMADVTGVAMADSHDCDCFPSILLVSFI